MRSLHVGEGSAHVIGMIAFAVIVYASMMVLSSALSRIAKLPLIGVGNAAGGAAVGIAKALVGSWIVLYVILFFPLTHDLRGDLRHSQLVAVVTEPNAQIDRFVRDTMPWFIRPLVAPVFAMHRL